MQIAAAFVEIRARQDQLDKDLADLERKVEGSAKSTAGKWASVFGTVAVGAGIKKMIDSASDLEQAVGGTAAVFGEARGEIDSFAKGAATSAGLSERAARELTSQLGGLLSGFGFTKKEAAALSIELTKLGGDLSATFGGKPEEAVQALGAAMRGETDPIERYGISLNQAAVNAKAVELGLASSTSSVDANAKAQATLAIITEKSAGAQGQFAREADSAAGKTAIAAAKTENAAASMGDSLLPIYSKAVAVIGSVADAFAQLPDGVQTGVIALLGVAAIAPRVVDGAKAIGEGVSKIGDGAGSIVGKLGGLGSLGPVFAGVGAAAGVVGLAWLDAAQDAEELRNAAKSLREEAEATGKSLEEVATENMVRIFTEAGISRKALDELGLSFKDLTPALLGSEADFDAWREATFRAGEQVGVTAGSASQLTSHVGQLRGQLDEAKTSSERTKEAQEALGLEQTETQVTTEGLTGALDKQREALVALYDQMLAQIDSNYGYRQAVDAAEDALTGLTELQRSGKATAEELDDATLSLEGAYYRAAAAAKKQAEDNYRGNDAAGKAAAGHVAYRDELARVAATLAEGSPLRARLEGYIADLDRLDGKTVNTTVTTTYNEKRNNIAASKDREHAALGGGFGTGAEVEVGEAGREVVQFGQPGTVIPNFDLGGRGGVTVNGGLHIHTDSPREFYDETLWRVAG